LFAHTPCLQAAKDRAAAEKETYQRQMSMSRAARDVVAKEANSTSRLGPTAGRLLDLLARLVLTPKAGDLSQFRQDQQVSTNDIRPSSVFAARRC